MTDNIETTLQNNGFSEDNSRVADLSFAFYNHNMLNLLYWRAKALKDAKFGNVAKIEDKLTREKNRTLEDLIKPNTFYCTFKHAIAK